MKKYIAISLFVLAPVLLWAQQKLILEEVVAVVGEYPLFTSELEAEFFQMKMQYEGYEGNLKCQVLDQLLTQKLLLQKAEVDSIVIDDARVEGEIERRLRFYAQQIGGEDALEKYLGKTIIEYKEDIRDRIRQQMLIEETRNQLLMDVKVSPTDVRRFFNEIPQDSLPLFDSEVEVGVIVLKPEPSEYAKQYALETITKLREEIVSGQRDFKIAASVYSDDVGSGQQGGELGYFGRGQMVPEFERAAFRLKGDTISQVVESEFGYHILQLIDRKGEKVNVRHILIKPKIVSTDLQAASRKLQTIVNDIKAGKLDFCKAVQEYSADQFTSQNCGFYMDPSTGVNKMELKSLEPDVALIVKDLKPGTYSDPLPVNMPDGSTYYRVLYLKSESPPHRANLKEDYQKIQAFALERKKQETLDEWAREYRKTTYVRIDDHYQECEESEKWTSKN